jgi:hypothetical protein
MMNKLVLVKNIFLKFNLIFLILSRLYTTHVMSEVELAMYFLIF